MNNWQFGVGGPLQQKAYEQGSLNMQGDIRLPNGTTGSLGDLVKYYTGGGQDSSVYHPTDLQEMQRQMAMGVKRG